MGIDRRYITGTYLPLRDAIDRLMEGSVIAPGAFGQGGFPPTDIFVTDEAVVVEMSIPGINPNDLNISVTGDTVSIGGEIKHEHANQKGQAVMSEIWRGKFQRSFTLPVEVDASKAEASYDDGLLTLTLPKSEATKPRKIQVKSGGTSLSGSGGTQKETVPIQSGNSSGSGSTGGSTNQ
jgi:HSP20 family protein